MVILSLYRRASILCLAGLAIGGSLRFACADTPRLTENEVKAAYLYNFAKFVDWPSSAMTSENFCIGILGEDPFDHTLDILLPGKTVQGKSLTIHHFKTPEEAGECQMLFVNLPPAKQRAALEQLSHKPVLTVGNRPDFVRSGGMIAFEGIKNTIRFEVNLTSAEEAQLKISSQLLKVAHDVRGVPKGLPQ